jgi:photosystem II stability/assembly factor-like uncharacterized protein
MQQQIRSTFTLLTVFFLALGLGCRDDESHSQESDGPYVNIGLDAQTDPNPDAGGIKMLAALTSPCKGAQRTGAMLFTSDSHGYIGCAVGDGLHETNDGGESWTRVDSSLNFYVLDLQLDKDGALLVCGHDYDTNGANAGGLLFRFKDGLWNRLLRYGSNEPDKDAVFFSDCAALAADNSGRILAVSASGGDLTYSTDNGSTWAKENRYWEDDNLDGKSGSHFVFRMVSIAGKFYAGGGAINKRPLVFNSSELASAEWWHFTKHEVYSDDDGEVRTLASPDNGLTLFAGGRLNDGDRGFIATSSDKGGTWKDIAITLPGGRINDICFAPDGMHGVACSDRQANGVVFVTADGGKTWSEKATEANKSLERCVATNDYFLVAGSSHLAKGTYQ